MADRYNGGRYGRSRSRSFSRERSPERRRAFPSRRSYSRSPSRSPVRRRARRSYSRSRSPCDRRRSYSRSPIPRRDGRNRSRSGSPRGAKGTRWNPDVSRVIGVFGLSLYTTERELRDMYHKFGDIDKVQVIHDHVTGRSRGFGFVYFREHEDAQDAKSETNGIELDGRRIRVDFSITRKAHSPTPGRYMGRPTRVRDRRNSKSRSRSWSR